MQTIPQKRLKNGFSMPSLGLGTWGMGGWVEKDGVNDEESLQAIRASLEAGITHIDTAERYSEGHAEELVGEAIGDRDRSKLFIVSKVIPEHLKYDDLLRAAEGSLKRLKTPYLDLYLIHDPNPAIPIEESMRAMNRLVDEGMIKHGGVSNFSIEQIEAAQRVSKHPVAANQIHYNLHVRQPMKMLDHAKETDWMLIAWRPIRDVLRMETLPDFFLELCDRYGKTPGQIAINWLIAQENVVTLSKCGTKEHLNEMLGALGWSLEKTDFDRLTKEFPTAA